MKADSPKPETHSVRIGPAGWQYPDWNGIVYPTKRPRGFDALEFVSSYFNLIEINSTFYRTPAPEVVASWVERTAHHRDFRFTLKAAQNFTHRASPPPDAEIAAFKRAVAPCYDAARLTAVLVQFPWSFHFDSKARARVDTLCAKLRPLPLALEVRHGSWQRDDALDYLGSLGVSVCGIDQPVIGDSLKPFQHIIGGAGAYFRLHGRNYQNWFRNDAGRDARYDYLYSRDELSPWLKAIRQASAQAEVSVVLNNHFRGQAPANAFELMSMLTGNKPPAPRTLRRAIPRLRDVTVERRDEPEPGQTGWLFDDED